MIDISEVISIIKVMVWSLKPFSIPFHKKVVVILECGGIDNHLSAILASSGIGKLILGLQ